MTYEIQVLVRDRQKHVHGWQNSLNGLATCFKIVLICSITLDDPYSNHQLFKLSFHYPYYVVILCLNKVTFYTGQLLSLNHS
jgi:hypothetical protein